MKKKDSGIGYLSKGGVPKTKLYGVVIVDNNKNDSQLVEESSTIGYYCPTKNKKTIIKKNFHGVVYTNTNKDKFQLEEFKELPVKKNFYLKVQEESGIKKDFRGVVNDVIKWGPEKKIIKKVVYHANKRTISEEYENVDEKLRDNINENKSSKSKVQDIRKRFDNFMK